MIQTRLGPVKLLICYDLAFPESFRALQNVPEARMEIAELLYALRHIRIHLCPDLVFHGALLPTFVRPAADSPEDVSTNDAKQVEAESNSMAGQVSRWIAIYLSDDDGVPLYYDLVVPDNESAFGVPTMDSQRPRYANDECSVCSSIDEANTNHECELVGTRQEHYEADGGDGHAGYKHSCPFLQEIRKPRGKEQAKKSSRVRDDREKLCPERIETELVDKGRQKHGERTDPNSSRSNHEPREPKFWVFQTNDELPGVEALIFAVSTWQESA